REGEGVLGREGPHRDDDRRVAGVVERVYPAPPIGDQILYRGRHRQPCPPIRLWRGIDLPQIEVAAEVVDDGPARRVLDDDTAFRGRLGLGAVDRVEPVW